MGASTTTGILLEGVQDSPGRSDNAYPDRLKQHEVSLRPNGLQEAAVALSGGGIRSATLSLGIFQSFARRGVLGKIGYVSTVSGGGYFGGFLGMLFCRHATEGLKAAEAALTDEHSREVIYLRENGRFLAPNGSGDVLFATAMALRNWVSVLIVVALPLLTLFAALDWLRAAVPILGSTPPPGLWWWSSWFVTGWFILAFACVPLGWAYWLVVEPSRWLQAIRAWLPSLALSAGAFVAWERGVADPFPDPVFYVFVGIVAVLPVLWFLLAAATGARGPASVWGSMLRYRLSSWLHISLIAFAITVGVTLVDSMGQSFYLMWSRESLPVVNAKLTLGGLIASVTVIAAYGRKLAALVDDGKKRVSIPRSVIKYAAAFGLLAVGTSLLWTVAHGIGWNWEAPDRADLRTDLLAWTVLVGAFLTWATAHAWTFVNRSSLHAFYESRIRRAYLGASNRARHDAKKRLTEVDPDDGRPFHTYRPDAHGGPIHLINVTVNETVDGRSQVQQQDRRGMAMAVGPAGVSVGRRHHALWTDGRGPGSAAAADRRFYVFPPGMKIRPTPLDIGEWLAISGAAFSTGIGAHTDIAMSLLSGMFNIRLGYWWDSGIAPGSRPKESRASRDFVAQIRAVVAALLPVPSALLDEWFARFHGVARRSWNLADGGHFENLGAYELIRRRLRFIIVCDNGQDGDYSYEDLSNLVRKARLDLDTEISFLGEAQLDAVVDRSVRRWFGTLDQLRRGSWTTESVKDPRTDADRLVLDHVDQSRLSLAHAALARIDYRDPTGRAHQQLGTLLYIKPTLTGTEPVDVLQYHLEEPAFPHEPTSDQFFDEAQWESYRRLGQHVAAKLFSDPADPQSRGWSPYWAVQEPGAAADFFRDMVIRLAPGRSSSTAELLRHP